MQHTVLSVLWLKGTISELEISLLRQLAMEARAPPRHADQRGVQDQNSTELKASTYLEARRQLDLLRREIRKVFANIDLLILPSL